MERLEKDLRRERLEKDQMKDRFKKEQKLEEGERLNQKTNKRSGKFTRGEGFVKMKDSRERLEKGEI